MNSRNGHQFWGKASLISAAFLVCFLPTTAVAAADKNHPTRDIITQTLSQDCTRISVDDDYVAKGNDKDDGFSFPRSLDWKDNDNKLGFKKKFYDSQSANDHTAYVIHVTSWRNQDGALVLDASSWYAYRKSKKDGNELKQWYTSTNAGDLPIIYGAKQIELIAIQKISDSDARLFQNLKLTYTVIPSQGTPENVANLGKVFAAFFGLQTSGKTAGFLKAEATGNACAEHFSIKGTALLPYDLNIKVNFQTPKPKNTSSELSNPTPQSAVGSMGNGSAVRGPLDQTMQEQMESPNEVEADTTQERQAATLPIAAADGDNGGGNNIARTLHVLDKEWWDISLSVAIPGVREPKVSLNKDNVVSASVTRHVDIYGFISLYPWAAHHLKNSFAPHFNVGLPFAGQPLHRSFAGVSEKLPWIEKAVGVPVNVFGGTVFLRQQISTLPLGTKTTDTATFTNSLQSHWVRKGMFGLEFPVSALVGKIGKK